MSDNAKPNVPDNAKPNVPDNAGHEVDYNQNDRKTLNDVYFYIFDINLCGNVCALKN